MADMERPDARRRAQPGDVRASDAEREKTVTLLQQHLVDGRITAEEFSERTDQIYESRTRGVLEEVLEDLPPIVPPASQPETVAARSEEHRRSRGPMIAKIALAVMGLMLLLRFIAFIVFDGFDGPPGPPGPGPDGDFDGPPFPFPFPLLPIFFIWVMVRAGRSRS